MSNTTLDKGKHTVCRTDGPGTEGAQATAEDIREGAQDPRGPVTTSQLGCTAGLMPDSTPTGSQEDLQGQPVCHRLAALWDQLPSSGALCPMMCQPED